MPKNKEIKKLIKSLAKYGFKLDKSCPTIDFVFPSWVKYGNNECFRFSPEIRRKLAEGAPEVRKNIEDKYRLFATNIKILEEIDKIVPRLKE